MCRWISQRLLSKWWFRFSRSRVGSENLHFQQASWSVDHTWNSKTDSLTAFLEKKGSSLRCTRFSASWKNKKGWHRNRWNWIYLEAGCLDSLPFQTLGVESKDGSQSVRENDSLVNLERVQMDTECTQVSVKLTVSEGSIAFCSSPELSLSVYLWEMI